MSNINLRVFFFYFVGDGIHFRPPLDFRYLKFSFMSIHTCSLICYSSSFVAFERQIGIKTFLPSNLSAQGSNQDGNFIFAALLIL